MGGFRPIGPNDSISNLMLQRGDILGRSAQRSGDIWGGTLANLGQIGAGAVQQVAQQKELETRSQAFGQIMEDPRAFEDPNFAMQSLVAAGYQPEEAMQYARGFKMFADSMREPQADPTKALEQAREFAGIYVNADPATRERMRPALTQWTQHAGLDPEGTLAQAGPDEFLATAQALLEPQEELDPGQGQFTLGGTRFDAEGNVIATVPDEYTLSPGAVRMKGDEVVAEGRAPARSDKEPVVAVMGPDGTPVYVPRSQAVGQRPANIREQGRPVTSGDANNLAELDTALGDLDVLKESLGDANATGTAAKAGAMVPNFITEAFGIGGDAKKKQALIDRVKQVIGKSLEGGVLRKEDEEKYKKILPIISDVPEVVDAKLSGLKAAILRKRQDKLEALEDAGYDVSRFLERGAGPAPEKPKDDPLGLF